MPTISLLVTGKTELKGLGALLTRLFPAEFRYANRLDQDLVEPRPELASLLAPGEPRCATWPPPQNNLLRNI